MWSVQLFFALVVALSLGVNSEMTPQAPLRVLKPNPKYLNQTKPFSVSCTTANVLNFVVFCLRSKPDIALPANPHLLKRPINCSTEPPNWSMCKSEFQRAFLLPAPTREETMSAWPLGEGHVRYSDKLNPKAKKLKVKSLATGPTKLGSHPRFGRRVVGKVRARAAKRRLSGPHSQLVEVESRSHNQLTTASGLPLKTQRVWVYRTIPYCYPDPSKVSLVLRFTEAFQRLHHSTVLRFVNCECNTIGHKLEIIEVAGIASSHVGISILGALPALFTDGLDPIPAITSQEIQFDPTRYDVMPAMHELLHSIGFDHAHQASNRDQFVSIPNRIEGGGDFGWCFNNVFRLGVDEEELIPDRYDYSSIMHYPRRVTDHVCRIGDGDTFVPTEPAPDAQLYAGERLNIGPSPHLTPSDIEAVNTVYQDIPERD